MENIENKRKNHVNKNLLICILSLILHSLYLNYLLVVYFFKMNEKKNDSNNMEHREYKLFKQKDKQNYLKKLLQKELA